MKKWGSTEFPSWFSKMMIIANLDKNYFSMYWEQQQKGIWFKSSFKKEWEIIREDLMRYENEIAFILSGIAKLNATTACPRWWWGCEGHGRCAQSQSKCGGFHTTTLENYLAVSLKGNICFLKDLTHPLLKKLKVYAFKNLHEDPQTSLLTAT